MLMVLLKCMMMGDGLRTACINRMACTHASDSVNNACQSRLPFACSFCVSDFATHFVVVWAASCVTVKDLPCDSQKQRQPLM